MLSSNRFKFIESKIYHFTALLCLLQYSVSMQAALTNQGAQDSSPTEAAAMMPVDAANITPATTAESTEQQLRTALNKAQQNITNLTKWLNLKDTEIYRCQMDMQKQSQTIALQEKQIADLSNVTTTLKFTTVALGATTAFLAYKTYKK